jgi:hypothetical protein
MVAESHPILDLFYKRYPLIKGEQEIRQGKRNFLDIDPNYQRYKDLATSNKFSDIWDFDIFDRLQKGFTIKEILYLQRMLEEDAINKSQKSLGDHLEHLKQGQIAKYLDLAGNVEVVSSASPEKKEEYPARYNLFNEHNKRFVGYLIESGEPIVPYSGMYDSVLMFPIFDLIVLRVGKAIKEEIKDELKQQSFDLSNLAQFLWWNSFSYLSCSLPSQKDLSKKSFVHKFEPCTNLSDVSRRKINPVGWVTLRNSLTVSLYKTTDLIDSMSHIYSLDRDSQAKFEHLIARINIAGAFIPRAGSLDDLDLRQCGLTTIREEKNKKITYTV